MADYEFETEMQVRFADIDAMHHVNNAVYATYLEQARVEYYADVLGVGLDDIDTVLVHLEIDYRRPVELDESVVVALGVTDVGESSVTMAYEVLADGEVAATGETVQVYVDPEGGGSRPLPEAWRERMLEFRADADAA